MYLFTFILIHKTGLCFANRMLQYGVGSWSKVPIGPCSWTCQRPPVLHLFSRISNMNLFLCVYIYGFCIYTYIYIHTYIYV